MILVDTSVWIDHFRRGNRRLETLLDDGTEPLTHPFILGELACGSFRDRGRTMAFLSNLPAARTVRHEEAMNLLENERLWGRGLGWIDIHLLGSARLTGCALWTLDTPLAGAAADLDLAS